jgi:hypothetical protein
MWAVVLRPTVIGANGGGRLRWSEPMVEVACGGWSRWWWRHSCMWAWGPPMSFLGHYMKQGSSIGDYIFVGTDEYIQIIFVGLDRAPTNI